MKFKRNGEKTSKLSRPWLASRILAVVLGLVASSVGCGPDPSSTGGSGGGGAGGAGGAGGGDMRCTTPQDCPLPAGECVTRTCLAGTCGTENVAAGTTTSAQTPGDCKQDQCDGKGAVVSMNDDADVPVDNAACTQDVCTNGVPSNPAMAAGTACSEGTGTLCDAAGACVECLAASDCAGTDDECKARTCAAGACGFSFTPNGTAVAAQIGFDCQVLVCDGAGNVVGTADDTDEPPEPQDFFGCMLPKCSGGTLSNTALPDGIGCTDGNGCTQGDTCNAGTCVTGSVMPCNTGDPCFNEMCFSEPFESYTCFAIPNPDGTSCGAGQVCNAGTCESSCFIGGTIYAAGAANPASDCQVCTPATSTSAWSNKADGAACLFGSCGAGACIQDPIAYIKASNTEAGDAFGYSVALSADGDTLVVGAYSEDSNATGINGDQTNNSANNGAGAVYVFTRSAGAWSQEAYIKASNTAASELFGQRLALSADGSTLAVGAPFEDSNATGINGDQTNNSASSSGAVYVFTRTAGTWSQQAYVKASNTGSTDLFGSGVALSADGNTLAVGAGGEDSNATGIGGDQGNNSASDSGAVYMFARSGGTWAQEAYVKASNTEANDGFGSGRMALSADGNTLAVGAGGEDSNATGIGGDQADNSAGGAGAVYVFARSGGTWAQEAYVKASNAEATDSFSFSLALSEDGNTLAVGAALEDSGATGIHGDQADNSAADAGAVYMFTRSGGTWSQEAYVKASNTGAGDGFGIAVALSADGNTLAVTAQGDASNATGINGDQADNSYTLAGAAYVLRRSAGTWSQQVYVKASNTEADDHFGVSVALSGDGYTLAVGTHFEDSNATGINGNQADNSAVQSGAVYVYSGTSTPATCQQVKQAMPGATDGDYTLYVGGDPTKPWTAFCKDMAGTPIEYLSFVNTMNANFSQYTAGGYATGTDMITSFTKVRIDPVTLAVNVEDLTYSTTVGMIIQVQTPMTSSPYAKASDCQTAGLTDTGLANVDLTGTPFSVAPNQFFVQGNGAAGTTTYSNSNRVVDLTGGGACGFNGVVGALLQLVYTP